MADLFDALGEFPDAVTHKVSSLLTRYKRPYSHMTHGARHVTIEFKLPNIKERDVFLEINPTRLILRVDQFRRRKKLPKRGDTLQKYFRSLTLPQGLLVNKAKKKFKKDFLVIKIPKERIR